MFAPNIEVIVDQPRKLDPPDLSFEGILRRCPGLARAEAVCRTGSTAVGWGNAFSDIDLYVFTDEEIELPSDEATETWSGSDSRGLNWQTWMGVYDNARIDMKIWPTNAVATVLEPYLNAEVEFSSLTGSLEDFVYRVSVAVPLKNADFFQRMRELVDGSSYRRALARLIKARAENRFMDVAGQLAAGDHMSARLAALLGAADVADACLILAGELCRRDKWLLRRLAAAPHCGIDVNEYRTVVLGGALAGESDGDCAHRVARWAQMRMIEMEHRLFLPVP